jgi:hypothetical protein
MRSITNTVLRGKSDEQLAQELATAEHILMVESFGFNHEARDQVRLDISQLYTELKRRGALQSQKKSQQQQQARSEKSCTPAVGAKDSPSPRNEEL